MFTHTHYRQHTQFFEDSINYNLPIKAMEKRNPGQEVAGFSFPSCPSSLCLCKAVPNARMF